MRRTELIELHDHPHFSEALRGLVTDALEAIWAFGNSYGPILPQLHAALLACSVDADAGLAVVDLCSGGGGPWSGLARQLKQEYGVLVRVWLTDKYPNRDAARRARSVTGIEYVQQPVDAMQVPLALYGFRTMFSSFHHFGPEDARAVLRDAVKSRRGIAIFEVPRRGFITLAMVFLTPLLVLALTPWIRPFRWSRLLWTYLVPVVPFVIWYDGCVSCFRAYSHDELRAMVQGELAGGYAWEVGEVRTGLLPVTYLIGLPLPGAAESSFRTNTSNQGHEVQ